MKRVALVSLLLLSCGNKAAPTAASGEPSPGPMTPKSAAAAPASAVAPASTVPDFSALDSSSIWAAMRWGSGKPDAKVSDIVDVLTMLRAYAGNEIKAAATYEKQGALVVGYVKKVEQVEGKPLVRLAAGGDDEPSLDLSGKSSMADLQRMTKKLEAQTELMKIERSVVAWVDLEDAVSASSLRSLDAGKVAAVACRELRRAKDGESLVLDHCVLVDSELLKSGAEKATKAYEALTEKGCSCKDLPCADGVADEMQAWAEKNKDTSGNDDQSKRIGEAVARFKKCKAALKP